MNEREARAALGEVYERLAHHVAPPLLEDLCQRVAFAVNEAVKQTCREERERSARLARAAGPFITEDWGEELAEQIRAGGDAL